jgi:hypothetical protein
MRLVTKSLGFLVFNPANDDYLAVEINDRFRVSRSWCSHPSSAKVFKTRQLAINAIRRIVDKTDKVLVLAELSETSKQYAVSYLSEFSFSSGRVVEKIL